MQTNQSRRQFLCSMIRVSAGAGATLLLAPVLGGCDDSNGESTPAPAATTNPTTPGCDGVEATSTFTIDHSHTVCVPLADINAPPAAGATYTTSPAPTDAHTHEVVLTQAQLSALAAGQTVLVTTSVVEAHTHDFSLHEEGATEAPPPPPPPPPPPGGY